MRLIIQIKKLRFVCRQPGADKVERFMRFFIQINTHAQVSEDPDITTNLPTGHEEWLHNDVALITDLINCLNQIIPWNMTVAWWTPVVLTDVQVAKVRTCFLHSLSNMVFFDVHVEGIQHDLDIRAIYLFNIIQRLIAGVEDELLKAIYYLHAQHNVVI